MRLAPALLLLALAACGERPAQPVVATPPAPIAATPPPRIEVPPLLKSCAVPPKPPPIPRTIDQVVAWAAEIEENRADCAERLRRLNELIEGAVQ